jgi:hypothetical protein
MNTARKKGNLRSLQQRSMQNVEVEHDDAILSNPYSTSSEKKT